MDKNKRETGFTLNKYGLFSVTSRNPHWDELGNSHMQVFREGPCSQSVCLLCCCVGLVNGTSCRWIISDGDKRAKFPGILYYKHTAVDMRKVGGGRLHKNNSRASRWQADRARADIWEAWYNVAYVYWWFPEWCWQSGWNLNKNCGTRIMQKSPRKGEWYAWMEQWMTHELSSEKYRYKVREELKRSVLKYKLRLGNTWHTAKGVCVWP